VFWKDESALIQESWRDADLREDIRQRARTIRFQPVTPPTEPVHFGEAPGTLLCKLDADEQNFAIPVAWVRRAIGRRSIQGRSGGSMKTSLTKDEMQVDLDHFEVDVNKQ